MSYNCAQHGQLLEFSPCEICLKALENEAARSKPPMHQTKYVHAPGPCPTCSHRGNQDVRHRRLLSLSLFLGLLGLTLGHLLPPNGPGALRAAFLVPAALLALLGAILKVTDMHQDQAE